MAMLVGHFCRICLKKKVQITAEGNIASPQTSVGVRLSRIHFSPMRDNRTPTDVCREAKGNTFALDRNVTLNFKPSEYMTQAAWKKKLHQWP